MRKIICILFGAALLAAAISLLYIQVMSDVYWMAMTASAGLMGYLGLYLLWDDLIHPLVNLLRRKA